MVLVRNLKFPSCVGYIKGKYYAFGLTLNHFSICYAVTLDGVSPVN